MDEENIVVGNVISWKERIEASERLTNDESEIKVKDSFGCTCEDWCGKDSDWDC